MAKRKKADPALVWAYCRVSTMKGEQELSLEEQVRWAEAFAKERGARLEVFRERASAKTLIGRPVCSRMLNELELAEKPPAVLLATSFDRLSRDMTDTLILARCVRAAGTTLFIRDRGEVAMDSFADQAALVGQAMGGHAENEARSNRCKASWQRRRREGKPMSNKSPYGLQLRAERDAPEPTTSPWVLRAFQMYAKGVGTPTIARLFQQQAPVHRVRSTRVDSNGDPIIRERRHVWEYNKVMKLLRQTRYRGVIVPEELFDRVQAALASKPKWRNKRVHDYPFSGAVKCKACGRSFHGHATGGTRRKRMADGTIRVYPNAKRTRYYSCTTCSYMIPADSFEYTVLRCIDDISVSKAAIRSWISAEGQLDDEASTSEQKRLATMLASGAFEKKRQRAWQLAIDAGISGQELSRQLGIIANEESGVRDRLAQIKAAISGKVEARRTEARARDLLSRFRSLFLAAPYEQQRELATSAVQYLGGAIATKTRLLFPRKKLELPWARPRQADLENMGHRKPPKHRAQRTLRKPIKAKSTQRH